MLFITKKEEEKSKYILKPLLEQIESERTFGFIIDKKAKGSSSLFKYILIPFYIFKKSFSLVPLI